MYMTAADCIQILSTMCLILTTLVVSISGKPIKKTKSKQFLQYTNRQPIILDALRAVSDVAYPTLVWNEHLANDTSAICRFQRTTDTSVLWNPNTIYSEAEYIGAVPRKGSFAVQARAAFLAWKEFNVQSRRIKRRPGDVRYHFQDKLAMEVGCAVDVNCKLQCNYNPSRCMRDAKYRHRTYSLFSCIFRTIE